MKIKVKKASGETIKSMEAKKGMYTTCGGRIVSVNKVTITVIWVGDKPSTTRMDRVKPSAIAISLKEAKKYGFKYMTRRQFEKSLAMVDV